MNSRERYIRALTFSSPDRVPVMHRTMPGAVRIHGQSLAELYARYPSDVLLSPKTHAFFRFKRGIVDDGKAVRDAADEWGCKWLSLTGDHQGIVVGHPLADWDKLETYRFPEPATGVEGIEEMVAAVRSDDHQHYIMFGLGEIWERTRWLRGFENAMIDVLEDRPEMYQLRDRLVEFLLKRVDILSTRRQYIDGVLITDDWGTQQTLMIRPEYWRRIYKPAYAQVVAAIHQAGLFAHLHTDGATDSILDDLIEIGFDEVNPQMSCMDIEDLGRRFGGRVCLRADTDRQYTLPYGSPAQVEEYVQRMFAAFGGFNGGYVGYGSIGMDVPPANVEALLRAFASLRYEAGPA